MSNSRCLLISPYFKPLKVIGWQTAITLIYLGKAYAVENYDETVSSPSTSIPMPAVIVLKKPIASTKKGVKFSRINVFQRDKFVCSYCGNKFSPRGLNYDHVIPRVKGGRTIWDNVVSSCYGCNSKKGGRTPEEAGMTLLKKPFKPKSLPLTFLQIDRKTIPQEWKQYIQEDNILEDSSALFLLTGSGS